MTAECTVDKYYRIITHKQYLEEHHPSSFPVRTVRLSLSIEVMSKGEMMKVPDDPEASTSRIFGRKPLEQRDEPHILIHPKVSGTLKQRY